MGSVGRSGPVPKRTEQRRRRNKPAGGEEVTSAAAASVAVRPEPDPGWHPIARDWFVALGESGQAAFYEPSDWQTARYVAEAMSRNLAGGRFSAQLFAAVMSASSSLLVTEGDRRRLRVELQRGSPGAVEADPAVASMAAWRDQLGAG